MTTLERVRKVLIEEMGLDADDVTPRASLIAVLDIDSLSKAQLILELEEEFGIEIPDDDMQHIATVQDVVTYADSHSAAV